jgi:chloride channel 3/4/5
MVIFVFLGVAMGIYGALFCKLNILWSKTFRQLDVIRRYPVVEVILVVLTTATVGWYNRYTRLSGTRLVEDLLSECAPGKRFDGLCPDVREDIPHLLLLMSLALILKAMLYSPRAS